MLLLDLISNITTRPSIKPAASKLGLDWEKSIVVTGVSNLNTLDGY